MNTRTQVIIGVAAAGLSLAGCGKGNEDTHAVASKGQGTSSAATPAPVPSGPTVTLSGTVHFEGEAPERKPIRMAADVNCARQHATPVLSEDTIVGADGEVQNAFVYVKSGLDGQTFAPPATAAVVDQRGCMYRPHVSGVQVGQEIRILNSDPTLHNVHALPRKGEFNVGMPRQGMEIVRKFSEPEVMVHFKCDVHPWMSAWVGVLPHPFFAVTDSTGTYTIANLPAGTYTIEAWHEKLGTREETMAVGAAPTATLDFAFQPAP